MSSAKRISSGRQFFYTYEDFQWPSYHCSNNTTQNGLYLSKVIINVKSNLNPNAVQNKKISEFVCKLNYSRFCSFAYKFAHKRLRHTVYNIQTNFNQLEQFLQAEYLRKYSIS